MERNFMTQAKHYLASRHKAKIGRKILFCLASIVVFSTVYALMLPAITMANEQLCGKEAHVHTEACWAMAEAKPVPEFVCDFMRTSNTVIHRHNEYCLNEDGRLICRLPEIEAHTHTEACYEQQKTLTCEERQEIGHTHTDACYTNVRGGLACTQEGGHTHTDACYTEKEVRTLTCNEAEAGGHTHGAGCYQERETEPVLACGQEESEDRTEVIVDEETGEATGETVIPGHTHSDACYKSGTESVLVCQEPEADGHTHTDGCYTVETLREVTCGLEESDAHVHNDNCYEWTEELACHEEEREGGHVHTDDCYDIKDILICREEEVIPHTHSIEDGCYEHVQKPEGEEDAPLIEGRELEDPEDAGYKYVLTCGEPEVLSHVHMDSCVYVPETVAEETVPTLICGREEHEHTEECYMEVIPEIAPKYYCGLTEHLHSDECWFDSGELRCTLTEHHHDDQCLIPELWQQSPSDVEIEEVTEIELDGEEFTAVTEDGYYEVTFHVTGTATFLPMEDGAEDPDAVPGGTEEPGEPDADGMDVPDGADAPEGEDGMDAEGSSAPSQDAAEPAGQPSEAGAAAKPSAPAARPSAPAVRPSAPAAGTKPSAPVVEPEPEPVEPPAPEPAEPSVQEPEREAPVVVAPTPAPEPDPQPVPSREEELEASGLAPYSLVRRLRTLMPGDGGGELEPDADMAVDVSAEDVEIILVEEEVEATEEPAAPGSEEGEEPAESQEVELIPARKLSFKAMLGGRELDLSQCVITLKVSLAPDLMAALESRESAVQTLDETEDTDTANQTESGTDTVLKMMVQDANGIVTHSNMTALNAANSSTDDVDVKSDDTVILELLDSVYPKYNIEFYAYIQRPVWDDKPEIKEFVLDTGGSWKPTKKEYLSLPFIDTSSEHKLPTNKVGQEDKTQETRYLKMTDGKVNFTEELIQLYQTAKNQIYTPGLGLTVPELDLVNKATGEALQTEHYDRKELWVLEPGYTADDGKWIAFTTDENLKDKDGYEDGYEYVGEDSSRWTKYTTDLESLKFTNADPKNTDAPDNKTIVIKTGTTLRVVYQAKGKTDAHQNDAAFYDYDITDSKIYTSPEDAAAGKNGIVTSGQKAGTECFLNTKEQGINSPANYKGEGTKFAFGNNNTDSNLGEVTWAGNNINKTNPENGDNNSPGTGFGCTFGMVNGISSTGGLTFNSGIAAPELFGTGTAIGKTPYGDYQLHFDRMGDTYTLTSVSNTNGTTVSSGLDSFHHPQAGYRHIWTNDFWPMDGVASHGTDGHDAKFGGMLGGENYGTNYVKSYKPQGMPASDDGRVHNSYFGMQFSIEFNLPETYMGPLEYFFYGDDDLWVFLDNKLVCDIGGVHSSIGEYVDLWDYLRDEETGEVDAGNHVLSFYYLERGASGSTCWMQYTLPNIASLPTEVEYGEKVSLKVTKLVEGDQNQVPEGPFDFTIRLTGVTDSYQTNMYAEDGKTLREISPNEDFKFSLANGESLTIKDLPAHAKYQVVETSEGLTNCHPKISVVSMGNGEDQEFDGKYDTGSQSVGSGAEITFTNAFYYELPSTGGPGIPWHTLGGGLLLAVGCLWYRKKPVGEGDAYCE